MILLFQGVRKSEPLHLFVDDIRPVRHGKTLKTQIRYYHPVVGQIKHQSLLSSKILSTTRSEFLQSQHERLPRNKINGIEYAGWKGISLEHGSPYYFAEGYWIIEEYSQIFLNLHSIYINEIRPRTANHPYYFVCLDRDNYGKPLTISAVNEIFERACHRMGVTPSRDTGVNIHGFRHRYGQTAVNFGLPPQIIQRMMHHSNIHRAGELTRRFDFAARRRVGPPKSEIHFSPSRPRPQLGNSGSLKMSRSDAKHAGPSHRLERVGETIRHAMAEILQRGEIADPVLNRQAVTIPAVKMSSDLKLATVAVMPLGGDNVEATIIALKETQEGPARAGRPARQSQIRARPALRARR